jgi:hypothetical protein
MVDGTINFTPAASKSTDASQTVFDEGSSVADENQNSLPLFS